MGVRLFCTDETLPLPWPVALELSCDGNHGLFPPAPQRFEGGGFITQHAAAMRAGWLERQDGERQWLCPCCSGKVTRK
jgi:hypothetical protein